MSRAPRLRVGLLASTLLGVLLLAPRPAAAVYECGGVQDTCSCGAANFCICCSDSTHGTDHGNCVWYAWHKACCEWAIALQWCTNADTWDTYAQNNGYPVRTEPCANTVFVCEDYTTECGAGSVGHVGWVETAYADGSIDVTEEGCYSFYGVHSRNFAAQNASPTMHYIYAPGTSCSSCECSSGDVDQQACGDCGTKTRTCGSDCQWGGWSACQNEGPCSSGATDSQSCGNCGTQTRACNSSCQWDAWSSCTGEGVCAAGATQACGTCGGSQTCDSSCQWGACVETCSDAGVGVDAGPGPDGSIPGPDGSTPGPDGGGSQGDGPYMVGGCRCDVGSGPAPAPLLVPLLVLAFLGMRRRPGA